MEIAGVEPPELTTGAVPVTEVTPELLDGVPGVHLLVELFQVGT
jgi:hypothetical protein